jgi:hypothetical protein
VSDAVVGALAAMVGVSISAWLRRGAETRLNDKAVNKGRKAPSVFEEQLRISGSFRGRTTREVLGCG